MRPAPLATIKATAAPLVGPPGRVEVLKDKPGRRRTVRVHGVNRSVIVKAYASARAPVVAARIRALANSPDALETPQVLLLDEEEAIVVLTEVPGMPLSRAILDDDLGPCWRAGEALGRWHRRWTGNVPDTLSAHSVERELAIIDTRARLAPPEVAAMARSAAHRVSAVWAASTVVHRDLYEEQIMVGNAIGLIDLDDAAAGPPELDVGNLLAHLSLLGHRHHHDVRPVRTALLAGYRTAGPSLDDSRLHQCERLSAIRLACIHGQRWLVAPAPEPPQQGQSQTPPTSSSDR